MTDDLSFQGEPREIWRPLPCPICESVATSIMPATICACSHPAHELAARVPPGVRLIPEAQRLMWAAIEREGAK